MSLEEELLDHMATLFKLRVTPSLLQSSCAILHSPWQCMRGPFLCTLSNICHYLAASLGRVTWRAQDTQKQSSGRMLLSNDEGQAAGTF